MRLPSEGASRGGVATGGSGGDCLVTGGGGGGGVGVTIGGNVVVEVVAGVDLLVYWRWCCYWGIVNIVVKLVWLLVEVMK